MTENITEFALTDEEWALLPNYEDVAFYAEHGWYLSPRLLSDEEIDVLKTASDRFYDGYRDRTLPAWPKRLAYWTPGSGDMQRHNDYIHYEVEAIARILRKPLIGAVAARLAEAREIRVFQTTLIYKPPCADEGSNLVPWHFDHDYWATSTSERMLTAFIPFHDCDEEMGTLTMVDGSHKWKDLGHGAITSRHFVEIRAEADATLAATAELNNAEIIKIPMSIPKGHMSFHHCRTYHGSGPNLSSRPRRAISLHLQDGDNAYRPFRLADGSLAEYNHDVLVRRTSHDSPDYSDPTYCPGIWRSAQ
jgi:hypothetical protein